MTDSYASSRNGELSPNGMGNGSSPSLVPTGHTSGLSSVIRKKLMGYVGFANLPNQVHRKSVRKGFQFTTMVVGSFFPLIFHEDTSHSISSCLDLNSNRGIRSGKVHLDQYALQYYSLSPEGTSAARSRAA